jgi:hypothetical protein
MPETPASQSQNQSANAPFVVRKVPYNPGQQFIPQPGYRRSPIPTAPVGGTPLPFDLATNTIGPR